MHFGSRVATEQRAAQQCVRARVSLAQQKPTDADDRGVDSSPAGPAQYKRQAQEHAQAYNLHPSRNWVGSFTNDAQQQLLRERGQWGNFPRLAQRPSCRPPPLQPARLHRPAGRLAAARLAGRCCRRLHCRRELSGRRLDNCRCRCYRGNWSQVLGSDSPLHQIQPCPLAARQRPAAALGVAATRPPRVVQQQQVAHRGLEARGPQAVALRGPGFAFGSQPGVPDAGQHEGVGGKG